MHVKSPLYVETNRVRRFKPAPCTAHQGGGGVLSPDVFDPQQATSPSLLTPQLWLPPAATWVKAPAGGALWPSALLPQQATLPSLLTPQLWLPPAATWVKASAGGLVRSFA